MKEGRASCQTLFLFFLFYVFMSVFVCVLLARPHSANGSSIIRDRGLIGITY